MPQANNNIETARQSIVDEEHTASVWDNFYMQPTCKSDMCTSSRISCMCLAKTFACYTDDLGPLVPKWKKESKISSQGLSTPGAQKVQNGVEKRTKVVEKIVNFDSFLTPFWTVWTAGAEWPRELISDSFCHFGTKGPKGPL